MGERCKQIDTVTVFLDKYGNVLATQGEWPGRETMSLDEYTKDWDDSAVERITGCPVSIRHMHMADLGFGGKLYHMKVKGDGRSIGDYESIQVLSSDDIVELD